MITRRHCLLATGSLGLSAPTWAGISSLSAQEKALHALNRLAYGPRPGDAAAIAAQGPQRWLEAFIEQQLEPGRIAPPQALQARLAAMETLTLSQGERLTRYREAQRINREAKKNEGDKANARRELVRPIVLQTAEQRLARALESPAQLEEVLVEFWFNHFNVFAGKGPVSVFVGDYEQRAIRPHVLGSFRAMLGATARHPAMLLYLDNAQSVAPGFVPPRAYNKDDGDGGPPRPRGLNENYARELMELHTLGVDGGYTQRDVTELARMLTGWTVDYRGLPRHRKAADLFVFDPRRHDSGSKQWLGRSIAKLGQGEGEGEGELALDVLASHPATARHIGFKLAQAFVADEPPPALVARLADSFLASQGDLKTVMRSLLSSEEFWSREACGAKFKTPYQYLVSSLRAVDAPLPAQDQSVQNILGALAQAGMPLYGAQTPDGYKNTAAAWMNPEALAQRIQLANTINQRLRRPGADSLLATLGPTISEATRKTVAAEPAPMQTALLLGSPDFMRR